VLRERGGNHHSDVLNSDATEAWQKKGSSGMVLEESNIRVKEGGKKASIGPMKHGKGTSETGKGELGMGT